ncbi:hypothetical protein AVEN_87551-1 [Araneus ventricosus]|uniref:Uncharacterized protein n=1 Tax=Araneus ventricosus TaxID=182803 RepID=A0A4Y2V3R6_ARAVE|nr:hypothetical protein AVEN_87551-1 [Araneus ventricosus]
MKKWLGGQHFTDDEELKNAVTHWLKSQAAAFFAEGIETVELDNHVLCVRIKPDMAGIDVSAINKFNGQNYFQWKFKINCALKAKGVFTVANRTKTKPDTDEAPGMIGFERSAWTQGP